MTKRTPDRQTEVAIIGGGAAGMMAAIRAAECGAKVTLFEKNDRLGKKLRITGKGRCNLTNDCDNNEFLSNVPTNPRFLYASLAAFSTEDTKAFFETLGVPLKTERGKRVFPVSDQATDVVRALEKRCRELGVSMICKKVISLCIENGRAVGLMTHEGRTDADAVIVCTGGLSYPITGSDGDGYRFARDAGHTVTALQPSLIPLVAEGPLCASLQGLSLRNVSLRIVDTKTGRVVYEDFGELLFTHFGLSGPMILSASAHLSNVGSGCYEAQIDLKPALDEQKLNIRLLSDFEKYKNRDFANALGDLLPQKMIEPFIGLCGIDPHKKVNSVTREERERVLRVMKCIKIAICGARPIREAIITRGGVSVKEIAPKTMESRLVKGLYFAGEVLDVDAYTGGFNLQIAFSTAVAAGESAAFCELI